MKKLITLFIAVLGSAFNTSAQEIKGVVVDATSKEVVPSATIIIEYSDKTDRTPCLSAVNYVKECDGTHSEYCARRVPTLRK